MDTTRILREAHEERDALRARVKILDTLIATLEALNHTSTGIRPLESKTATKKIAKIKSNYAGFPKSEIHKKTSDAVAAVLRREGRPIPTRDLLPLVRKQGLPLGNDTRTLSALLNSYPDSGVSFHPNAGWWFKDQPVPPMGLPNPNRG